MRPNEHGLLALLIAAEPYSFLLDWVVGGFLIVLAFGVAAMLAKSTAKSLRNPATRWWFVFSVSIVFGIWLFLNQTVD